ncbi:hypothetical protein HDK64DRAFT_339409 [Phyllosticta capitalensis]
MLRRRSTMPEEQAVNFMKERFDGSVHAAFDTRPQIGVKFEDRVWKPDFQADTNFFETRQDTPSKVEGPSSQEIELFYTDCIIAQQKLDERMERYQSKSRNRCIEMTRQQTWTDVEDGLEILSKEVAHAESEYRENLGSLRSGFRRFSNNANSVKVFADLIPSSDSYLSVLCGGIKLVCVAASRIGHIRKVVTEFLLQVHSLLDDKGKLLNLYREDVELHRRNADLSTSILVALGEIVRWMHDKPWKKTMKGMLRPDSYEHDLVEKIEEIKSKAAAFKDQASICGQKKVVNIESNTLFLCRAAEKNQIGQGIIYDTINNVRSGQEYLRGGLEILNQHAKALNHALELFQSDPKQIQQEYPSRSRQLQNTKPTKLKYRVEDLLEFHDPAVLENDYMSMRKLQFTMKPSEQDRAVALLRDERLQGFVAEQNSGMLLIHGHGNTTSASPVSFVCAKLVESLVAASRNEASRILTIAFFCGRHRDWARDLDAHPPGMLLSLLLQLLDLLRAENIQIESRPLQRVLKRFQPDDVESVLEVIVGVCKQLPKDTMLFVVVDAVVFYEDRDRRHEMRRAVEGLLDLAFIEEGPLVKVLMSSPSKTQDALDIFRALEGQISQNLVLDMRKSYPSQGGFRSLNWTIPSSEMRSTSDDDDDDSEEE